MGLITEKPAAVYDLSQIYPGCVCFGRHRTWDEGKTGVVTSVTESQITVQYHPDIGNVTNHFVIPISEVTEQEWEIRWSADLSNISEYRAAPEQEDTDESGTADI
ncbi:MAG: DUF5026 domain-containing protein [Roseburia sp.]|nr:DUF5026 domain-containing protein [Roseburia sp.]